MPRKFCTGLFCKTYTYGFRKPLQNTNCVSGGNLAEWSKPVAKSTKKEGQIANLPFDVIQLILIELTFFVVL